MIKDVINIVKDIDNNNIYNTYITQSVASANSENNKPDSQNKIRK